MSLGKVRYLIAGAVLLGSSVTFAQVVPDICPTPNSKKVIHTALKAALIKARNMNNGGFNLDMWGTVVNRDGVVCAVAYTGADRDDQWPGSRVISAQKANTANSFSLKGLALSTANLWEPTQPGGSLYGLQHSNPVATGAAYDDPSADFGTDKDPLAGQKIGGVNVFGGGLALYNAQGVIVGAVGVSGDSSCADHNIAWRVRNEVQFDYAPNNDQIIYMGEGVNTGGFGHPVCSAAAQTVVGTLPALRTVTP